MTLKNSTQVLIILLCLLFLSAIIATHPALKIDTITITGTHFIPKEKLQSLLNPIKGKNILSLYLNGNLKTALNAHFPQIETLRIIPNWPSEAQIQIQEKPIWASCITAEKTHHIAKDATILNNFDTTTELSKLENHILIQGIPESEFQAQNLSQTWTTAIAKVIENLSFYLPPQNIGVIFTSPQTITLIKDDTLEIKLGTLENLDLKFRNLKYYLEKYSETLPKLSYIDLRLEDRIITY